MTTRLHIGAKELRGELAAYAKRFDLLEVRGMDAPSLRLGPSAATLRRWRKVVPPEFEFCVVAGPNVAKLKPTEEHDLELAAMLDAAKLLEARVLLVPTPVDVTPSKLWRERLEVLLDKLPRDATSVVWEPSGLWEIGDAAVQANKWGIAVGVDPSRDPIPAGPVAYCRLRSLGATRAYSTAALQKVALAIGERRDAYVVIETPNALKEGKTLRALVRGAKAGRRGGFGTIVRPAGAPRPRGELGRATIRARDDEQEE